MVRNSGPGLKLLLLWLGTIAVELIMALYTFKTRLAPTGMDAGRAYTIGVVWEIVHLVLVVVVLPALFLAVVWRSLQSQPVHAWRASRIALAWLVVPTVWLFGLMAESMLTETVLSIYESPVITIIYCLYGLITLTILAITALWLMRHSAPGR